MKIITLTLNPAFDVHCCAPNFQAYHENLAEVTLREAGGKGVNISRALTAFGVANRAFVVLGEENAADFRAALEADGLEAITLSVAGRIRENMTLHTDGAPETRISFRGFAADGGLLARVREALLPLVGGDTVVTFTGRLPEGISVPEAKAFLLELRGLGARLVIDSRSFSLADILDCRPWLIKPNEEEIAMYASRAVTDLASAAEAARDIQVLGVDNVMISMGALGAVLASADGIFTAAAPSISPQSTIGAGDSSIAGFLAASSLALSPTDCLRYAISFGSAACLTPGTRPPCREDVLRFLGC